MHQIQRRLYSNVTAASSPATITATALAQLLQNCKIIDCTHALQVNKVSHWPHHKCGFTREQIMRRGTHGAEKEYYHMGSDNGTHMDSPAHFFKTITSSSASNNVGAAAATVPAPTISQLSLAHFIAEACVINIQDNVFSNNKDNSVQNANYAVTMEDVQRWEERHKKQVPTNSIVCMKSGWSSRFTQPDLYCNFTTAVEQAKEQAQSQQHQHARQQHDQKQKPVMQFPHFSESAVEFLLQKRQVVGIGVDTLSPDSGSTRVFPVHRMVLGAGKFILENLQLQELPESGAVMIALPLNVQDAAEAPTRVIALVPPVI